MSKRRQTAGRRPPGPPPNGQDLDGEARRQDLDGEQREMDVRDYLAAIDRVDRHIQRRDDLRLELSAARRRVTHLRRMLQENEWGLAAAMTAVGRRAAAVRASSERKDGA